MSILPPEEIHQDGLLELEQRLVRAETLLQLYEGLLSQLTIGVMMWHLEDPADDGSFRLIAANPAMYVASGFDVAAEAGRPMLQIFPQALESGLAQIYAEVARSGQARDLGEVTYGDDRVDAGLFAVHALPLGPTYMCTTVESVTERKRTEEALRQAVAQEETIRAQMAILDELSTPLIPVNDRVVIMPLIGAVDSRRAQKMTETLLMGISTTHAQVAILDITGVPVVDTQVANALVQAAQAVQLLGARVILTGIRPEVAQTLVGMGVDLQGMITRSTLQSGIAYALERSQ
jgi:rsbT co-antagonist protein RsbR